MHGKKTSTGRNLLPKSIGEAGINRIVPFLVSCTAIALAMASSPILPGSDDALLALAVRTGQDVSLISVVLGRVLSFLYRIPGPAIPWYGLYLYAVHIICLALLIKTLCFTESVALNVFRTVLILLFYAPFLLRPGFNNAALMIGASSIIVFLPLVSTPVDGSSADERRMDSAVTSRRCLFCGLLLSLSYLTRLRALDACLLFSLPLLVSAFFRNPRQWRRFLMFGAPVFIVALLNTAVHRYATSPEFREHDRLVMIQNRFYHTFHQSANYNNIRLFEENGWSPNDYSLFAEYFFFPHEGKYNHHTLSAIFRHTPRQIFTNPPEKVAAALISVYRSYFRDVRLIALLTIIAIVVSPLKKGLFFFGLTAYWFSGIACMAALFRFPPQIAYPILYICALFLLYQAPSRSSGSVRSARGYALSIPLLLTLIVMASQVHYIRRQAQQNREHAQLHNRDIAYLNSRYRGKILVIEPSGSLIMAPSPLTTPDYGFGMIFNGWTTFSPWFYSTINNVLGIRQGRDLLPALVGSQHAFIVSAHSRFNEAIETFYRETYDLRIRLVSRDTLRAATIYSVVADDLRETEHD